MMKPTISVLVLAAIGVLEGCRGNNTFYITSYRNGLLFGPFQNKDYSEIKLAADKCPEMSYFTVFDGYVTHPSKWMENTYRCLHETIVSIDVKDQTLAQFVEMLNEIQRKNGVRESDRVEFSARIHHSWFGEEVVPDDDVFVTGKYIRKKIEPPLITMRGEDISLFDVLLHLSHLLSHRVWYFEDDHKVEIRLIQRLHET